jgi:hypothetical protein
LRQRWGTAAKFGLSRTVVSAALRQRWGTATEFGLLCRCLGA